jgi:hypothetical protein
LLLCTIFEFPIKNLIICDNSISMTGADNIRNNIIDKLLTISNAEYLAALYQLVSNSSVDEDVVQLSEAQILMLNMSEDDIKHKRIISQEELDKADLEWLKSL